MEQRKKLDLNLNQPTTIEMLFDEPKTGKSTYGDYYCYAVKIGNDEYSYFATPEVHEKIKGLKKGQKAIITKTASQKGTKVLCSYTVEIPEQTEKTKEETKSSDPLFQIMEKSYDDAIIIQKKYNGMVDPNRIAITLFIARSKINPNSFN